MIKIKRASQILATLALVFASSTWAVEAPLWQQFKAAKAAGTEPTLPDFSYAGYNYSETETPDTSDWTVFNVTTYGAIPNDGRYDDVAIQAAINAAETAGGGIVLFPAGRFMVSPDEISSRDETIPDSQKIRIQGSNIVLKGQGSQIGGTEIFKDKMKVSNGDYIFEISPPSTRETTITQVVADAQRETFEITVANASTLSVGQRIILRTDSIDFAHDHYDPQVIDPAWTRLLASEGYRLREIHTIAAINGNVVRLREPLHITLEVNSDPINVRTYPVIENVGIEDILFKGNWDSLDEAPYDVFIHHFDDIHDYAWNAVRIDNLANGWIRDVEFKDWNQGLYIDGGVAITVENISFTGKKGHTSVHTRRSYGILIKDSQDLAGYHHGPGLGYSAAGTVYLRYQMVDEQRMDSHSGGPYATLFDNVRNGHFDGNGGPHESYPHHGKYFVAWNFYLKGGPNNYDFWRAARNGHTFAMPFFVGLQGDSVTMTNGSFSANELPGQEVQPISLFEAQLGLRLGITIGSPTQHKGVPYLLDFILNE